MVVMDEAQSDGTSSPQPPQLGPGAIASSLPADWLFPLFALDPRPALGPFLHQCAVVLKRGPAGRIAWGEAVMNKAKVMRVMHKGWRTVCWSVHGDRASKGPASRGVRGSGLELSRASAGFGMQRGPMWDPWI